MIKRTIYVSSECHLSVQDEQLKITNKSTGELNALPIEDIGYIILDNRQITYTHWVWQKFAENNIAAIICDSSHLPAAMVNPLSGHTTQTATYVAQIQASEPMRKSMWKQTVVAKINNQAAVLKQAGKDNKFLKNLVKNVKSGDIDNREGVAARHYWSNLFDIKGFKREREGIYPNELLNYTYALIRAGIARALIASGLLPTLGIHHQNKYNPMCLADDIMEPFRPFADKLVYNFIIDNPTNNRLNKDFKLLAMNLLASDAKMRNIIRPMMIAFTYTTASVAKCFQGKQKTINYPELI